MSIKNREILQRMNYIVIKGIVKVMKQPITHIQGKDSTEDDQYF